MIKKMSDEEGLLSSKHRQWLVDSGGGGVGRTSSDSNATRDAEPQQQQQQPPPPKVEEAADEGEDDDDNDEDPSDSLDDFYGEVDAEALPPGPVDELEDAALLRAPFCLTGGDPVYRRSTATAVDGTQDLIIQHCETDYTVVDNTPVVRLWGVLGSGESVLVRERYFRPYFYVEAPSLGNPIEPIIQRLEAHMHDKDHKWKGGRFVLGTERVRGESIYGFQGALPDKGRRTFYRITMALPTHVAAARNCLENGNALVVQEPLRTYEANVPFELRYMIDKKLNGCQWFKLPAGQYRAVALAELRESRCALELELLAGGSLKPLDMTEHGTIAQIRTLSFDIEVCNAHESGFPSPEESPVIMICAELEVHGVGSVHKAAFALRDPVTGGGYEPVDSATDTYVYDTERELLLAFRTYVLWCDPECFTGWNINKFDLPYLAKRAERVGIGDRFMDISRIKRKRCWIRRTESTSRAFGTRETCELLCAGRYTTDGIDFMQRCVMKKYRSYSLNAIAELEVGDRKLDVDYSQIPLLFHSKRNVDRTRLLWYCLKDTMLPLVILRKLMAVVNMVEQARVTGVPIKWLLTRGQGVKTFSNMLRYKAVDQFVPSRSPRSFGSRITTGGHVEDPKRGLYEWPTISLDFGSLYPSIMRAHNICYSTKVSRRWAEQYLKAHQYWSPYPSVDALEPEAAAAAAAAAQKTKPPSAKIVAKADKKRSRKDASQKSLASAWGIARDVPDVADASAPPPQKKKTKKDREREAREATVAGKPTDFVFVRREEREGVLPKMLDTLVGTRNAVKNLMEPLDPKRDSIWSVYYSRQNGIKLACNSVYGFLKAYMLVDKDLMAAVTSWGRNMLRIVKETVDREFGNVRVVDWDKCKAAGLDPEEVGAREESDIPEELCRYAKFIIVYGDTDSVMCNCGPITLSECIRVGKRMSASCTAKFEKPNTLNFEAIKLRGLFVNPKNYAAMEIEKLIMGERIATALARAKQSVKGMAYVRRDNAPIGSETQGHILKMIVRDGDVNGALAYVKGVIADLLMNRVDMSKLVITKGLTKTKAAYKSGGTNPVHLRLADKIRKRAHETGEVIPDTGDRVPYVMLAPVAKKGKGAVKTSELGEDPLYALRNGAPVDVDYYMYKQLWPPIVRVFTAVMEPQRCRDVDSDMPAEERDSLLAHQALFNPSLPHMQRRVMPNAGAYGIGRWARPQPRCLGCGNVLSERDQVTPGIDPEVCRHCDGDTVRTKVELDCNTKKRKHEDAWKTCLNCQGGAFTDVTCSNRTCGNFFHRDRVTLDMEDAVQDVKRLYPPRSKARFLLGLAKRPQLAYIPPPVIQLIVRSIVAGVPNRRKKRDGVKVAKK